MSRRKRVYFKECDPDSDVCEFCSHNRDEHVYRGGACELCGCRKFWVDEEEMKAFDEDE